MHISVDRELCESNGVCVRLVPEVFALDDDDRLRLEAHPPEALRERIEAAVRRCPKQALSIVS
jgi:ferredoxin